ncbi:MAG: hypothetical protein KUG73_04950 [Pseudomonadales bacterium]|nr:hypothetical protein [Pseudomonadales bacterium]
METAILEGTSNPKIENRRKELRSYSHDELIDIFSTLEPASIEVLQGEVDGCTLASKGRWGNIITWLSTHTPFPGVWLGKGFTSNRDNTGRGYNRFTLFGIEHRSMRFATGPGLSLVDSKPVMLMDYKPYFNPLGLLSALDEIRQLDDNNYLLCGHWKWPFFGRSQILFYHIYGPLGKFKD